MESMPIRMFVEFFFFFINMLCAFCEISLAAAKFREKVGRRLFYLRRFKRYYISNILCIFGQNKSVKGLGFRVYKSTNFHKKISTSLTN